MWLVYFQLKFKRPLHWYFIILFYSILHYGEFFQFRQVLFLILILNRCFFDGFEQNKIKKGVIISLHQYVPFYFKLVCLPWQCEENFALINVKTKLDSKRFKHTNLVMILWNFLILCTNLKSCIYWPKSQYKFEAFQPFCELQIFSDSTQMCTHPQ